MINNISSYNRCQRSNESEDPVTPDARVAPLKLAAGKDPAVTVPTVVIEERFLFQQ
jgi:hypothetical protein